MSALTTTPKPKRSEPRYPYQRLSQRERGVLHDKGIMLPDETEKVLDYLVRALEFSEYLP